MNWTFDRHAKVPVWRLEDTKSRFILAFSSRLGGVSPPPRDSLDLGSSSALAGDVLENRRRLLEALRLDPTALATAGQIHGTTLRSVSRAGHVPESDGLLTHRGGPAVAVATADCMALLFAAPRTVAAVHAGWRGAAAGLPATALSAVCAAAAVAPADVRVALGPCIRVCCYEVRSDVAANFPPSAVQDRGGRLFLDLPGVALGQLRDAGLPIEAFHDLGVCTACQPGLCFSYRRDGTVSGRLWGVAALRPGGRSPARDDGRAL